MSPNSVLHIAFLNHSISFPQGMASSTRLRLLARGLADQGGVVTVLIMKGTERPEMKVRNRAAKGLYHGVHFEYMTGTPERSNSFLLRRWYDFRGLLCTCFRLWQLKKSDRLDVVIFYNRNLNIISFFSLICRWLKVPTVLELCEWPLAQTAVTGKHNKSAMKFCSTALGKVDAVLPISSFIEKRTMEFQNQCSRSLPSLKIPILVDIDGYLDTSESNADKYLVYCGSLNYYSILQILISIAKELKRRGVKCQIKILGGHSATSDIQKLNSLITENDIAEIVEIFSYLEDESFRKIYQGAQAMLAPLPDDLQTRSRFPTKIGEYLASARPVLTTPVGEVKDYLEDRKTAFITAECSSGAIADKIEEILKNHELADRVGKSGRDLACAKFHYSVHGPRLYSFLQTLTYKKQTPVSI